MQDPRTAIIDKRLENIGRILVFASSKGGVGKSSCAVAASVLLSRMHKKVGLLDMDFHGASDHIFLGVTPRFPEEEGGILPIEVDVSNRPEAENLRFMSITPFTGEHGIPLRGGDISNAILELLAVTIWGKLDYLIIDMPPGIGDEMLDLLKYIRRAEIALVSTPGVVSLRVVERLAELLKTSRAETKGVIINNLSPTRPDSSVTDPAVSNSTNLPRLGSIPFDPDFEASVGSPEALASSPFTQGFSPILNSLIRE